MKKKMALLLVFAMIVTTSITMPFASFAASTTNAAKEITAVYGAEEIVKTAPTKTTDTTADKVIYTAEYTYTPKWNISVVLNADKLSSVDPTITVATKDVDATVVTPTDKTYKLTKGIEYKITLSYSFSTAHAPKTEPTELELKVKAATKTLTAGTPAQINDIQNDEIWYEIDVDNTKGKGVVFSILSGVAGETEKTKVNYSAKVYSGKTSQGESTWNDDYEMMFECPAVLTTGKYYVKVYPNKSTTTKSNLKLSATMISAAEIDVNVSTPTTLTPRDTAYDLTLYSFCNRKSSGLWYKLAPTIPSGEKAKFEFEIDFGSNLYGDVAIALLEGANLDELIDDYAYVDSESNKFYAELSSGTTYYLRLTPIMEIPKIDIKLFIKPHTCQDAWFVSDADNQEISYGCPCESEDSLKASCTLDAKFASITYTGEEIVPVPTMVFSDWYLPAETIPEGDLTGCYTVSLKNSKGEKVDVVKSVGKYTATIKFCKSTDPNSKDSLEGLDSITKTVKVVPAGTTINSVTAGKKAFTVKWNKQTTKTTGYQIQYSTSSKFTKAKTVTISKNTTASKKINKLSAKKKYYVRVRTYKTVSGTKYYSAWSAKKSVTTKK